jgi:two-component system, NarL family, invasion response regulator UvrY
MSQSISLFIADDHPIVREGIKRIISECVDMRVVGEAIDGHDLLAKIRHETPDVLLLDVSMPGPGFLQTMRRLRADDPTLKVLVLSVYPEDHYAVRALKAGAAGYLTKDHSPQELSDAIRQVCRGRKYITASLAEKLAGQLESEIQRPVHEYLSDREYQIFAMLGAGKSVTEIAAQLAISPKTVSTYRTRILAKTSLSNNADIIRYAVQNGLVE